MPVRSAPPKRTVIPDMVDFRDRVYQPSVVRAPAPKLDSLFLLEARLDSKLPPLDQGDSNACTGFALASVVNYLRRISGLEPDSKVSARMLYSMARRYDEFPGSTDDTGSSARGALKGWFRHGAAAAATWSNDSAKMPPPDPNNPEGDWWFDAVKRPLGAYYRVEARSIPDLHVALAEVGVVYATALCHGGWLRGFDEARRERSGIWEIPVEATSADDGGHAFMIYGYDSGGLLIQNSWGEQWGTSGTARLCYEDWLANAMDCWVAQLGVTTSDHLEVAKAGGLRYRHRKVALSRDEVLREREISPFVIDMENDGRLSDSGRFRTKEEDLDSLLRDLVPKARADWKLPPSERMDVVIYAHGGLTSEEGAAKTAARWIPAFYEAKIFPIFFFWETGLYKTLQNILEELLRDQPRPAGGLLEKLGSWWDRRLERLLAAPGTAVWGEMKENAKLISADSQGGGQKLYAANQALNPKPLAPKSTRLHLLGHSAGATVHCHLAERLAAEGWSFDSVTFMAPAARVDEFENLLLPLLKKGRVARYTQLHLQDAAERKDDTCRPILGYGRSLLYLVSESFEGGVRTPILGMERYYNQMIRPLGLDNVRAFTPADIHCSVATHGGFDDDDAVRQFVIKQIRKTTVATGHGKLVATGRRTRTAARRPRKSRAKT